MKNFIYTTLLVFASLFCQAFGAQYEPPTILDTTICVQKGDTIKVYEYEEPILQLLESREKEIWSKCCDNVSVELKGVPDFYPDNIIGRQIRGINNWPAVIINGNSTFGLEVTYVRHLRCSNILKCKDDTSRAALAMWHLFGDLLSETETGTTMRVSDTAFVTTEHKVYLKYQVGMSFPDNDFKIQGDSCISASKPYTPLTVPSGYESCQLKWIKPDNVDFTKDDDTQSGVTVFSQSDNLFPIVCIAISCTGDTVSDTIKIGKPTPTPKMEDLACIAANETSFDVKVKEPDSRFSYHWIFEEADGNRATQFKQGDSVEFEISSALSGVLQLYSTGGCKGSDTVTQVLHRSVVAGNIQLQGDTNCVFIGDTLRFVLQNAPQDSLVWKSATGMATLLGNAEFICNTTGWNTNSFKVSVSNKNCPERVDSNTFNIRENFRVSIEPRDSCISAHADYMFKVAGNGINPIVEWYSYGVEIDTNIYKQEDSIRLKLTNEGGKNLYVAFKAKECGRESKDSLVLHSRPEIPQLDTLWKNCIPLGIDTSIELRVQPQEGATFLWNFLENEKFHRVAKSDSPFIRVATNYALLDADRNIPIMVNVQAKRGECTSDIKTEYLSVFGAGLSEEWKIGDKVQGGISHTIGFYQSTVEEISNNRIELDSFNFEWNSSVAITGANKNKTIRIIGKSLFPFNVYCLLTNKNTSCYSYYSATIEENTTASQSMVSLPNNSVGFEETDGASDVAYTNVVRTDDNPIDGIGIVLAPNPTQGNTLLYLGNTNIEEQTVIEIFTEQGVCLYRKTVSANIEELPTARFRSGLYFVRVRIGEEEPLVKKLIVK